MGVQVSILASLASNRDTTPLLLHCALAGGACDAMHNPVLSYLS